MSLARAINRGAFLNARLGVNGTQKASRSFGTDATGRAASGIESLLSQGGAGLGAAYSNPRARAECGGRLNAICAPDMGAQSYTDELPHRALRPRPKNKAFQSDRASCRSISSPFQNCKLHYWGRFL